MARISRVRTISVSVAMAMLAGVFATVHASAKNLAPWDLTNCSADVGNPPPGSQEWDLADKNNFYCGYEGWLNYYGNPAMEAATAANTAHGSLLFRDYIGDPFREPTLRWAASGRGEVKVVNWTPADHQGNLLGQPLDAVLLSPKVTARNPGPFPGIVIPCHSCFVSAKESDQFAMAESLAESGYLVIIPYTGGNSVPRTVGATDFFVATKSHPDAEGEYNPWWQRLDRTRLGIAGHSGAGGLSLTVGNNDSRFSGVVALDPAGAGLAGVHLRIPSMIQVADYAGNLGAVLPPQARAVNSVAPLPLTTFLPYAPNTIRHTAPSPTPGSKYTYFDSFRAAAVDTMQVGIRATTHIDWGRPSGGTFSTFGESVAIYYALAWFDRYVRGAGHAAIADNALRRLTAKRTFDRSADVHSIGTGFFDALKAYNAGKVEAGNVPITIGGISIRNRLSFWYPTRYFFTAHPGINGPLKCADLRNACVR